MTSPKSWGMAGSTSPTSIRLRDGPGRPQDRPGPHVDVMTYEREMMRNEIAAVAFVERTTRVPVPTVDFADLSHELTDADYFFMPFIDADNLGILQENGEVPESRSQRYSEQLGALNRDLNAIRGRAFRAARADQVSLRGGPRSSAMLEDVLHDGERARVDLGWSYGDIRSVIAEHAASLDDVREPRFVEWDLWHEQRDGPRRQDRRDHRPRARVLRRSADRGRVHGARSAGVR